MWLSIIGIVGITLAIIYPRGVAVAVVGIMAVVVASGINE